MTFAWIGNKDIVSDEDIAAIVADMRAEGLELTWEDAVQYLGDIDPYGTLNIDAQKFVERAEGLGL